jgi:hypothetical protein
MVNTSCDRSCELLTNYELSTNLALNTRIPSSLNSPEVISYALYHAILYELVLLNKPLGSR